MMMIMLTRRLCDFVWYPSTGGITVTSGWYRCVQIAGDDLCVSLCRNARVAEWNAVRRRCGRVFPRTAHQSRSSEPVGGFLCDYYVHFCSVLQTEMTQLRSNAASAGAQFRRILRLHSLGKGGGQLYRWAYTCVWCLSKKREEGIICC